MCLSGPGSQAGPRQWLLLREVTSTTIRHIGAHRHKVAGYLSVCVYVCARLCVSTCGLNEPQPQALRYAHVCSRTKAHTARVSMYGIFQIQLMAALALVAQVGCFTVKGAGRWPPGGWHRGITNHLRRTYDLHFSATLSLGPDSQAQMHY